MIKLIELILDISLHFLNGTEAYYKKHEFYNKDGSINLFKVDIIWKL